MTASPVRISQLRIRTERRNNVLTNPGGIGLSGFFENYTGSDEFEKEGC